MKTLIATTALTILFLSAGAFASNNKPPATVHRNVNMTVIEKNQNWPVAGLITVEPCTTNACVDA